MRTTHRLTMKRQTTACVYGNRANAWSMIRAPSFSTMSSRVQALRPERSIYRSNTGRFSQPNIRIGCRLSITPQGTRLLHADVKERVRDGYYSSTTECLTWTWARDSQGVIESFQNWLTLDTQ